MRYLITGSSGYLGSRVAERLALQKNTDGVVGVDIRPPEFRSENIAFRQTDIRDAAAIDQTVAEEQPDVLIHMAFVMDPTQVEPETYEVNVNGTFNVLAAAASRGVERAYVTTATMAYGAWPETPSRSPRCSRCTDTRATCTRATRPRPTGSVSSGRRCTASA